MVLRSQLVSFAILLAFAGFLAAQTGAGAAPARGTGTTKKEATAKKEAKAKRPIAVTPSREAAVMTFVERNHAELSDLLVHLKANQPEEYEQAVRDLFRTTERLALIQERDPLQYELELAFWTAQSRVQLLAAKLKMGGGDDIQSQLRTALGVQGDARVALLKHERQKTAEKLSKVEGDITRFETNREKVIDRQLQTLLRSASEGRTAKNGGKNQNKNAAKTTSPKSPPVSQPTNSP